ncbi:MAG: hypothetical protein K9M15_01220 [Candidatus Marinimicrobia bacterium]|nr:hypothetical protein [Candidatus Neomarinimicrobiota bacterium]
MDYEKSLEILKKARSILLEKYPHRFPCEVIESKLINEKTLREIFLVVEAFEEAKKEIEEENRKKILATRKDRNMGVVDIPEAKFRHKPKVGFFPGDCYD